MVVTPKQTNIAYRCPTCGDAVYGLVGRFALAADLVRLKCTCGASSLDMRMRRDKKVEMSVPCVFCKKNHTFTLSQSIVFERDQFLLNCPYANMDIAFLGESDRVDADVERTGRELEELLQNLEADKLSDIQPQDMDEGEILPDPAVYDTVRFLVRELEADGAIDCPCHSGAYDLRFTDGGIEVFCPDCGASHIFSSDSLSAAQDYATVEHLALH